MLNKHFLDKPSLNKIDKLKILKSLEFKTSYEVQKEFIKMSPEAAKTKDRQKPSAENLTELTVTLSDIQINKLNRLKQLRPDLRNTADLLEWLIDSNLKIENNKQDKKIRKMTVLSPNSNSVPRATQHEEKQNYKVTIILANNEISSIQNLTKITNKDLDSVHDTNVKDRKASNTAQSYTTETDARPNLKASQFRTLKNVKNNIPANYKPIEGTNSPATCSFVSKAGKRCHEIFGLEVDHIHPKAKGGSSLPNNLRWLCKALDQLAALEHFGQSKWGFI